MGFFGTPKEKRTQLFFRDDGKATFRKMLIELASFVEKDKEKKIVKGWKHFYKLQFPFAGYKNVSGDMVTLAFDRHYVLDYFNVLNEKERPPMDGRLDSPFVSQIASDSCYRIDAKTKGYNLVDKMIMFFGFGIMLEIIGILIIKGTAAA